MQNLRLICVFKTSHWRELCHVKAAILSQRKGSSHIWDNNPCFTFSSVIPRNAWQRCELHHKTRNAL